MNRVQIIKALECCVTPRDNDCDNCPLDKYGSVNCKWLLSSLALDVINELTEENKRLELQIEVKERILESYMLQYGTVADKEVWLKKERADTVRKVRERLAKHFLNDDNLKYIEVDADYIIEQIDRIAEEILEGSQ